MGRDGTEKDDVLACRILFQSICLSAQFLLFISYWPLFVSHFLLCVSYNIHVGSLKNIANHLN